MADSDKISTLGENIEVNLVFLTRFFISNNIGVYPWHRKYSDVVILTIGRIPQCLLQSPSAGCFALLSMTRCIWVNIYIIAFLFLHQSPISICNMASSGLITGGSLCRLHRAMLALSSSCVICSIYGFSYLGNTISNLSFESVGTA